jgi:HEAT repeat protein
VRWLAFIALALGVLSVLFLLGLVARRFWLEREERRRRAVTDRLRPSMLRLIDGDDREGRELRGQEAEFYSAQLARYAGSLRGEARDRITRWFEESGAVSTEIGRLRDWRAWRRATAAFALGNMGSRTAVPALVLALKDRNKDVRSAAVRSLGRLRAAEAIEPVVGAAVERRVPRSVVSAAALEVGAPVVPFLLRLLGHERPAVRSAAVELIGLLPKSGRRARSH